MQRGASSMRCKWGASTLKRWRKWGVSTIIGAKKIACVRSSQPFPEFLNTPLSKICTAVKLDSNICVP